MKKHKAAMHLAPVQEAVETGHKNPDVCFICSKGFSRRPVFDEHIGTHFSACMEIVLNAVDYCHREENIAEPNQCPYCGQNVASGKSLRRHLIFLHLFKDPTFIGRILNKESSITSRTVSNRTQVSDELRLLRQIWSQPGLVWKRQCHPTTSLNAASAQPVEQQNEGFPPKKQKRWPADKTKNMYAAGTVQAQTPGIVVAQVHGSNLDNTTSNCDDGNIPFYAKVSPKKPFYKKGIYTDKPPHKTTLMRSNIRSLRRELREMGAEKNDKTYNVDLFANLINKSAFFKIIANQDEENDQTFVGLANSVKTGPVDEKKGGRKRIGFYESGPPITVSHNNINNIRKNDFKSSVTSQNDAGLHTCSGKTNFDNKLSKSECWGVIKAPKELYDFQKRAKYDTTPKSSKRSREYEFDEMPAEYYSENIINNVLSTTFGNLNSSSKKAGVKQPTQSSNCDDLDLFFDDTKENVSDEPKAYAVKPVQLLRPPKWSDIQEEFYRPDFWDCIAKMHGLRSGNLGEWVKGLDEQLTIDGLLSLKDGEWLNADIIDVCFRNICFHYNKGEGRRVEPITTDAILSYQGKRELPSKWHWNLAEVDLVVAPVHLNNDHWATVVIHVPQKKIVLYDSLNHRRTSATKQQFLDTIIEIMTSISKQQNLPEFSDGWEASEDFNVPQQKNGLDCGVFSILFAAYAVLGWEMDFRQAHIPFFRRKFCSDLIQDIILFAHRKQEASEDHVEIIELDEDDEEDAAVEEKSIIAGGVSIPQVPPLEASIAGDDGDATLVPLLQQLAAGGAGGENLYKLAFNCTNSTNNTTSAFPDPTTSFSATFYDPTASLQMDSFGTSLIGNTAAGRSSAFQKQPGTVNAGLFSVESVCSALVRAHIRGDGAKKAAAVRFIWDHYQQMLETGERWRTFCRDYPDLVVLLMAPHQ